MRVQFFGNRSRFNWTAIGVGVGAEFGAATHAMAACLAIGLAVGALADALLASRASRCEPARTPTRDADDDGRSAR